jgi:hypothetical protein
MMPAGLRKAALYVASMAADERRRLLAALPVEAARVLAPMVDGLVARGWNDPELVRAVLSDEIRGLTAQSSLSVDALLALAKAQPDAWTARLFAAHASMDRQFLLALLDGAQGKRVQPELERVPRLPPALRDALLAEASASVRTEA